MKKTHTIDFYFDDINNCKALTQEEICARINEITALWQKFDNELYLTPEAQRLFVEAWEQIRTDGKLVCRMHRDFTQEKEDTSISDLINSNMAKVNNCTAESAKYIQLCQFSRDIIISVFNKLEHPPSTLLYHFDKICKLKNEVAEANLKLVIRFAKEYQHLGVSLEDLIQEGNLGLMRAIEKFDTAQGLRFTTYATWWVKQGCLKMIKQHNRMIRIPHYAQEMLARIAKKREEFRKRDDKEPTLRMLAETENISEEELEKLYNVSLDPISLEAVFRNSDSEGGEKQLKDYIEDVNANVDNDLDEVKLYDDLEEILDAHLTSMEKQVIIDRYGLFKQTALTLEEIASKLERSRERVRQIEDSALKKLKIFGDHLKDYL